MIASAEVDLSIRSPANITFEQLEEHDGFSKKLKEEPVLNKVTQRAKGLYNKKQTNGVHAGGVVISPTMIPDYSPLGCSAKGVLISQFDKDDVEDAGLVKLDILGVESLSVMCEANAQIERRHQTHIDVRTIDRSDADVFGMINKGLTQGLFQVESPGMQSLIKKLQPESIGELGVLSALFRPGALQSGMVEDYVETKHGLKPLSYDHPAMQVATSETYGCIVYQEQVMSIARLLAGYTLGEADQLRRAMGKKKLEEMLRHKRIFIGRALKFWREDNIKKGEALFPDFKLDVDLSDLVARVPALNLIDALEDGVFASPIKTIEFVGKLLSLSDDSLVAMKSRFNDIAYTVGLFKGDYQQAIYLSVEKALAGEDVALIEEAKIRIYYAISQWARFHWIFNKIEKFAGYGFNKSHAIGYAFITYDTAYFKYHYSVEYYSSCMTYSSKNVLDSFAKEAYQYKRISLLKPDVNKSEITFQAEGDNSIRYGLSKLRDVKEHTAGMIVSTRDTVGAFLSLWHFCAAVNKQHQKNLPVSVLYTLAMTGAFDSFIPDAVKSSDKINGRGFVNVLVGAMQSHPLANHQDIDDVMDMSGYDIYELCTVWCLALHKKGLNDYLKKHPADMDDLSAKVSALLNTINFGKREREKVEAKDVFARIHSILVEYPDMLAFVMGWVSSKTTMNVVDTVFEEKRLSGVYMTSTPLTAIDAYSKIEREPPGKYIDGCPVYIPDVNEEYEGDVVSTVGVVKSIEEKTITNPDSTMFNQKMLVFALEDGMYTLNASIVGTKAVNYMKKFIEENVIIMAIGRIRNSERFGLSLMLEACKRYYPEATGDLIRVPEIKNGKPASRAA